MASFKISLALLGCALAVRIMPASAQAFTEYPLPTAGSRPTIITVGPDGNLWFTETSGNKIGKITTAGALTEYPIPAVDSGPTGITAGPDGNLWFAEYRGNKIAKLTVTGTFTEYPVPSAVAGLFYIAAGPDGNLWFTEFNANKIGRITTSGTVTEYMIPTAAGGPTGITAGPDGNLWFTEFRSKIGVVTVTGRFTEYPIPSPVSEPQDIITGPDGNLWFTELSHTANKIGTVTTTGIFAEYSIPPQPGLSTNPTSITTGPDGNLWFTELNVNRIGRITTGGAVTEYIIPTARSGPYGIAMGADGNVWFTESTTNQIGMIDPRSVPLTDTPTMTPTSMPTPNRVAIWNGGAGNWSSAANWGGGIVPNNGADSFNVFVDGGKGLNSVVALDMSPTISNLRIDADAQVTQNVSTSLTIAGGNLTNNGTASLTTVYCNGGATLSGTGTLVMNDHGRILSDNSVCTNAAGNTLRGTGVLLDRTGGMRNDGTIIADRSTGIITNPNALDFINHGTLRAENGAALRLLSHAILNDGGIIEAADASVVYVDGSSVTSGTVQTSGSGVILADYWPTFRDITNNGTVVVPNGMSGPLLEGRLFNNGSWVLNSNGGLTSIDCTALLTGSGSMIMSNSVGNRIIAFAYCENDVGHTIRGAGTITGNYFINRGTIVADQQTPLTITHTQGLLLNEGLLRAVGSGITIGSDTFTNVGTVRIDPASAVTCGGHKYAQKEPAASAYRALTQLNGGNIVDCDVEINGGRLEGTGTVGSLLEVRGGDSDYHAGEVSPGKPIGTLKIDGNYVQFSGATLTIDIGGTTAGSGFDQLIITGAATLDGNLNVRLVDGFTPSIGSNFAVITYASHSGAFTTDQDGLIHGNGATFSPNYTANSLVLSVVELTTPTPATPTPSATSTWTSAIPCGVGSQPCCQGTTCRDGSTCNAMGTCQPCGADHQPCCGGNACLAGLFCEDTLRCDPGTRTPTFTPRTPTFTRGPTLTQTPSRTTTNTPPFALTPTRTTTNTRPPTSTPTISPPMSCCGDADGDGTISTADATKAMLALVSRNPGSDPAAQCYIDGFVTSADVTRVILNLVNRTCSR